MKCSLCVFLLSILYVSALTAQSDSLGHERWEYILEETGDILQIALPITAGIMTLLHKDFKGTKRLALSYGTTFVVTHSLKYLTRVKRPEGRNRYDSFPSGHTSSAFSGASFIQRRYGWTYGLPAYAFATVVGVSRIEGPGGYHTIWDVLGGAVVGIGSTYLFTRPYENPKVDLTFLANRETRMVRVVVKF